MRARRHAFTLLELLVALAIIAVLAALALGVFAKVQTAARKAASTSNLRQFAAAAQLYAGENDGAFFPYRQTLPDRSVVWWFGYESTASLASAEGQREIDRTRSPLYPYLQQAGKIEVCPGFRLDKNFDKPKYGGASYGYGYNVLLGGGWMGVAPLVRLGALERPARVILFATCAQVNTFQAPASPSNPLLEEFPGLNQTDKTIHFRFARQALVLFADGHVESLPPHPGTIDKAKPEYVVGRVTPVGSFDLLR